MADILFTVTVHKKHFILAICILLAALLLAGAVWGVFLYKPWYNGKWNGAYAAEDVLSLTKRGEDLKILQVTDLHVDRTNNRHEKIWHNLEALVRGQDIDLTVITGDWTSDENNSETTQKLISVMERCEKPWAVVFGNHDSEGKASRAELSAQFEAAEHCLFARGPEALSGEGNYIINIYNHENPAHLDASLVLLDSHFAPTGTMRYKPVYRDQVKWYDRSIAGINRQYLTQNGNEAETVPSLLFLHVPLHEYADAWENGKSDTAKHLHGSNNEDVYHSILNTGLFSKILENKSTKGVFCGHDHANLSAVEYKGVLLAYGVQTGTCESDPFAQKLPKGGNLITLKSDGTLTVKQIYHAEPFAIAEDAN